MSLPRAAIAGALGFAVGLFIAGLLGDLMLLGFFLGSGLGAGAIAFSERRRVPRPFAVAGAGAVGGGLGFFVALLIALTVWEPTIVGDFGEMVFIGALGGAFLGLGLGIALGRARVAATLAAVGAIAFGIGFVALEVSPTPAYEECCTFEQGLRVAAPLALAGAIGGGILGAAFDAVLRRADEAAWARREASGAG